MEPEIIYHNGKVGQRIFSFPKKMIKFIIKTSSGKIMLRLYLTCKYFYKKASYCIVDNINFQSFEKNRLELENFDDCIDIYEDDEFESFDNVWVTQEICVDNSVKGRFLYPKIVRCEARIIIIHKSEIKFKEYKILTKCGKVDDLKLIDVEITQSDGSQVALEELLKLVPAASKIYFYKCHNTPQTMEVLLKIQWKQKFEQFGLILLDHLLDEELFYEFIKKNVGNDAKVKLPSPDNYGIYSFEKLERSEPVKIETSDSFKIEITEPPHKKIKYYEWNGDKEERNLSANLNNKKIKHANGVEDAKERGLPQQIIKYVINSAKAKIMKKLHRTCKYFFKKAPYLFIDIVENFNLSLGDETVRVEEFKGKNCWITGSLNIYEDQKELYLLIPKIAKCNKIYAYSRISYKTFELLTKFKLINGFYIDKLIDENGDVIHLEKILAPLINLKKIRVQKCNITPQSLNTFASFEWENKIKHLYLININAVFDTKLFYKFLQKALAPKSEVLIEFTVFTDDEEGRLAFSKAMKREIETWRPKKNRPAFRVMTKEEASSMGIYL